MTNKTNLGLVAWAMAMLGEPYWYGTCCYPATSSLLKSKTSQYPTHFKASRTARYKEDIARKATVTDCIGLVKGFYWTRNDGKLIYGLDGRPDKGANGMFSAAKIKGGIASLPEIPGLLLYSPGHVGVYVGGEYAVEARGFDYGVVRTEVRKRSWTHWYQCPHIAYVDREATVPPLDEPRRELRYTEGEPLMAGDDVRWVQQTLQIVGYFPGQVDGAYGPMTEKSVRVFQAGWREVTGVVNRETWAALEAKRKKTEAQEPVSPDEPSQGEKEPSPAELSLGARTLKYVKGRKLMSGDDVRALQLRLSALGYNPGNADGQYGPQTEAAVKQFQAASGIGVDGIVGADTRAALES